MWDRMLNWTIPCMHTEWDDVMSTPISSHIKIRLYGIIYITRSLIDTRRPCNNHVPMCSLYYHCLFSTLFDFSIRNPLFCRLILIAEKSTVYEKFPTPLINRLEKHFVLTSSILEDWQEKVLRKFQEWISKASNMYATDFTSELYFELLAFFKGHQV